MDSAHSEDYCRRSIPVMMKCRREPCLVCNVSKPDPSLHQAHDDPSDTRSRARRPRSSTDTAAPSRKVSQCLSPACSAMPAWSIASPSRSAASSSCSESGLGFSLVSNPRLKMELLVGELSAATTPWRCIFCASVNSAATFPILDNSISSLSCKALCGFATGGTASISTVLPALRGAMPGETFLAAAADETTALAVGETVAVPTCRVTGGSYG